MAKKEKELTERLAEPETETVWTPEDAGEFDMDNPADQEEFYNRMFGALDSTEKAAAEKAYKKAIAKLVEYKGKFEVTHGLAYGVRKGG